MILVKGNIFISLFLPAVYYLLNQPLHSPYYLQFSLKKQGRISCLVNYSIPEDILLPCGDHTVLLRYMCQNTNQYDYP